jgi:hypothetical protein
MYNSPWDAGRALYTNVELTECGTRVDGTPISCRLRYRSRTSRQDEQDKKMLELLCEPRVSTIEAPTSKKGSRWLRPYVGLQRS